MISTLPLMRLFSLPFARLKSLALALAGVAAVVLVGVPQRAAAQPTGDVTSHVTDTVAVDRVWSGHPGGFDLLVEDGHTFIAYYDAMRQLTVAHRPTGHPGWRYTKLDSYVGWDSHNYIEMALDSEGHLHLSGNMHVDPLIYFRTTRPYDVRSLRRVETMVEPADEERATYPIFLEDKQGRLIFKYRSGESGDGNEIYNIYDTETKEWQRLLDEPLVDGEGERNAYFEGPTLGPDGRWHLAWVWRESPDAATNHDLSYAVSDNLTDWETSTGRNLTLPITLGEAQVVDDVPVRGGMINGNTDLGFDHEGRPTITYHKFGEDGNTQIYVARAEGDGEWEIYQISDWEDFRWDFGGGGSIKFQVGVSGVRPAGEGRLAVDVERQGETATWLLDAETLEKGGEKPWRGASGRLRKVGGRGGKRLPRGVQTEPEMQRYEDMQMMYTRDARGTGRRADVQYLLSWEALGPNRDRARAFIPPPSTLRLYRVVRDSRTSDAAGEHTNAQPRGENGE